MVEQDKPLVIKGEKYKKLKAAMKAVRDYRGKSQWIEHADRHGFSLMLWDMFTLAQRDLETPNSNYFYQSGYWIRMCEYDPEFQLHEPGMNKAVIEDALERISSELFG